MVKPLLPPFETDSEAAGLIAFVDGSPTPFHAVVQAGWLLEEAGFTRLAESDPFPARPGRHYLVRGGSLVAWSTEGGHGPAQPFRIVGAHTDSPTLHVKPQPDLARAGWQLLGVEVYGGPLLNSWLDRDLALSGRVAVRDSTAPHGVGTRLLTGSDPILRVAQLAIHLDRTQNEGLTLNRQAHLSPLWALGAVPGDFTGWLAEQVGVSRRDVLGWDVMTHDTQPSQRIGRDRELLAAPRLDNLATSYAATRALVEAVAVDPANTPVVVLFDHEEVGSQSERGAMSTLLPAVLERIVLHRGGGRDDYLRALAGTVVASGDMAHATHPNFPERHEPQHLIAVNGGPVLKVNAQLRYATDGVGAAAFRIACEQAHVPMQRFVSRSDLPCGSTVGPMTSALLGATTVDFGAPMLSMHSARELMGARDPAMYAAALAAFLAPA
ncbi:MAG: M18 family aminopeptidase [Actinomycetota bacterium]|nr:M18 family aminopeptidase [Actinomycetota bacterium]